MKLKELVKLLEAKQNGQEEEVEFLVVEKTGLLIAVSVETKAAAMIGALKMFCPKGGRKCG